MKRETSSFSRLLPALLVVIVVAITFASGCRLIDVGGDSSSGVAAATISGRVVKGVPASIRGSESAALLADDIVGSTGVASAEVWIEDLASDPRFRTFADSNGAYLFSNVPAGEHRVIISYLDADTNTRMKTRSAAMQIGETSAVVVVPDLVGEPAKNVVTGQLRDVDGEFLREGTALTIWGETFFVGEDGTFTSPALPESASEAEIFVQLPGGSNTISFTAPFASDVAPALVELTVGVADNGNHAPSIVVSASVGVDKKPVSRVDLGTVVTLRAVGSDVDSGDQAVLVPTWSVTSGTLAPGTSEFEKLWTVPDYFTVATITIEVKDPKGATGKVRLPILVGINDPGSNTPAKSSDKAITAFGFPALSVTGNINSEDKTIAVSVPYGTDLTALVAAFTLSDKATIKVADATQASGTTANDFSLAVIYIVTAEDGSTANYIVTVTVTQPMQIELAAVTMTVPVLSAEPQDAAAVETATSNADYAVTGLTWNEDMTAGGKFKAGQVYTATLTLTSQNNKKFQAAAFTPIVVDSASVGEATTTGADIGNRVSFTVSYARTGALEVADIAVTTQPTKMNYAEATDGVLALDGMVITETNNDGSTNVVTFTSGTATGYTTTPANGSALTNATNYGKPVLITHTASNKTANTDNLAVWGTDYTSKTIDSLILKFVPAGTFQRGNYPANTSYVSAFRTSQHQITRTQFLAIMGSDPSDGSHSSAANTVDAPNDPVQVVSWYHAITFCNKLSLADGLQPAYTVDGVDFDTLIYADVPTGNNDTWNAATCSWSASGYRLPTEMEWMWAAMGADTGAVGAINTTGYAKAFAGAGLGGVVGDYAWYSGNSNGTTHPVGQKKPNELGLYDMSGNVYEWCRDWYGIYPEGNETNYTGPDEYPGKSPERTLHGGNSWVGVGSVIVAERGILRPYYRARDVGFRVVRP